MKIYLKNYSTIKVFNMKIIMLVPIFYPHIGGVEKHVKEISKQLIKKEHEVILITEKYEQELSSFEILDDIKIFRFPKTRLYQIWFWIYNHRSLIRNADIIHCHDFATFIYWYLPFKLLYPFKPIFITFHGYEGIIPIPREIIFLRKTAELLTKRNICIGDFIPKWYGTKADIISYGGVNLTFTKDNINYKGAVFIGRLEKDTGIITYVDAIKILKNKHHINLEVNICGDGSLRKKIEEAIKVNEMNIRLFGFVENPIDYLTKCRFAFVSGYLAILEAMISKKLVFSVYNNELKKDYLTSIPDFRNRIIITSSPEDLADKIAYMYKNPDKEKEIIDNAYDFAKNQTWEEVTDIYLKLWGVR